LGGDEIYQVARLRGKYYEAARPPILGNFETHPENRGAPSALFGFASWDGLAGTATLPEKKLLAV
jgi:hypothetical protein